MQVLHGALELPQSHGVVFTNPGSGDGVIPDSTIRRAMQRAGVAMSPHGFRSTFRTWAQERGENWEAAEISLSHRVGGSVVASYARSDMLEMRRALMERYAGALGVDTGLRGLGKDCVWTKGADDTEARYREGVQEFEALLGAQNALYAARNGVLDNKLASLLAAVDLYTALGGGWRRAE